MSRVITRADASHQGISPSGISRRCRVGRWQRLAPSVYLTVPPALPADWLRAAALHGGPGAAVSGAAALAGFGFRSVEFPATVLVLVPAMSGVASWGRIRVRRTARPPEPVRVAEIPLAPVARAVADHVVTLRYADRVQAVVAEGVQRRMCVVPDLAVELAAGPRRGSKLFREALEDVGHGARSVPEARAGRLLRAAGFTGFEQNVEILVGWRRLVPDFLLRAERAVVEVDSTEYHLTPQDHDATLRRDQVLQSAGYAVLHVKPSQVHPGPGGIVDIVASWLAGIRSRAS